MPFAQGSAPESWGALNSLHRRRFLLDGRWLESVINAFSGEASKGTAISFEGLMATKIS